MLVNNVHSNQLPNIRNVVFGTICVCMFLKFYSCSNYINKYFCMQCNLLFYFGVIL